MKFYSKTQTVVQREARKILRLAVRGRKRLMCVTDPEALTEYERQSIRNHSRQFDRIIAAFETAKSDDELTAAIKLSGQIGQPVEEATAARPH